MSNFICPVCGRALTRNGKSLVCEDGHNFDTAKSGYTNLLLSQQTKAKHHGDDRLMVRSRQAFLDKGYYTPLLKAVCEITAKYAENGCRILDAGCGECWYTANIYEYLKSKQIKPEMFGIDISKAALSAGAKRNSEIELAVASAFHIPVKDDSCDIVLSVFAPFCAEEFGRVLKNGGVIIKAYPLERHLWALKAAVYDKPYENEAEKDEFEGFELSEKREILGKIHLPCNEDILSLFEMTPYYYKTGADDQKKLQSLSRLDTEIEFGVSVFRKKQ